MHIVFVAPEAYPVPPFGGNSVEIYVWHLARQLASRHKVTVISRSGPGRSRREVSAGVRYIRVPPGTQPAYLQRVAAVLRQLDADVVQVENRPHFLPVLRPVCRRALVLNLHSMNFVPPGPSTRRALRYADAIIVNSHYVRRVLRHWFPEAARRSFVLHPGADADRFHPYWSARGTAGRLRLRAKLGLGKSPVVLYVGRVIPRKGVDVLLQAMRLVQRRHPGTHLLVAGGDWRRKKSSFARHLAHLAGSLDGRVHPLGPVRHDRLPGVYAAADCLVCPSQLPEALGLVNLEAMSSGLPVAASDAWGIPEVVKDGDTGLLVKRFTSPRAFAEAVHKLLADPEKARQFGLSGRRLVDSYFNWSRSGTQVEGIYATILGARARRQRNGDKNGHTRSGNRNPDHGADA